MGKTIAEKIFSNKSSQDVRAGDIVIASLDHVMAQDGTSPLAIQAFEEMGVDKVWDRDRVVMVIDHNSPSPNDKVSFLHNMMRDFAKKHQIILYDIGEGVCHQLLPERGHVFPGDLIIGADSHTCTYGALNAFSTGVGSTDLAAGMATGKLWFKVPESIKVVLNGKLGPYVLAKDLILFLAGELTSDGATYKALEFHGEAIQDLSVDGRMTLANMAIELGAKAGLMPWDEKTGTWLKERGVESKCIVTADENAKYSQEVIYNVEELEPQVACPHTVDNVCGVSEVEGTPIHQGVIGTCTNGRIEDFEMAAEILGEKKIKEGTRLILAPASKDIFIQLMKRGVAERLIEAGGTFVTPGCGPCVGTHDGVPSNGENVISTANRNFKGRMGNTEANIYLASPATVAASLLHGHITDPRGL